MWNHTYKICDFSIELTNSMTGRPGRYVSITFPGWQLEQMSDDEIIQVCRQFQERATEIEIVNRSCEYGLCEMTARELLIMADSPFASDEEKAEANSLLNGKVPVPEHPARVIAREQPKRPGYVYLIKAEGTYVHKIGRTQDVEARMDSLRNGSPCKLTLVHTIQAYDMYKLEKRLHEEFANRRTHGEWFSLTHTEIASIKEL